MFEHATQQVMDPILGLMSDFRADPRDSKINLAIGVYKDDDGQTPVLKAVKAAEERIWRSQTTKEYVSVSGDVGFLEQVAATFLPARRYGEEVKGIQAVGGSGALRLLLECAKRIANPTVWVTTPSWQNHNGIARACGLHTASYHYLDATQGTVDITRTLASLEQAKPGDIVLIHLTCHNPTGVDFSASDIGALARFMRDRRLMPLIDAAYAGFGDTIENDVRKLAGYIDIVPEAMVALSFSKTFALYRERTGAAFLFGSDAQALRRTMETIFMIARGGYSMPPDHGSRIVRTVLEDQELAAMWQAELAHHRAQIRAKREGLAKALAREVPATDWTYIREGAGMFSLIDIDPKHVERMKAEDALYIMPSGRLNLAGVIPHKTGHIAKTLAKWL